MAFVTGLGSGSGVPISSGELVETTTNASKSKFLTGSSASKTSQEILRGRVAGFELSFMLKISPLFKEPEFTAAFFFIWSCLQTLAITSRSPYAKNLDENAKQLVGQDRSENTSAQEGASTKAAIRYSDDKSVVGNHLLMCPIEDLREHRNLLQDIKHCRGVPIAGHRFKRIIEGLKAEQQQGELSFLNLDLVTNLIKNLTIDIPRAHTLNYRAIMVEQLREVALQALEVIKVSLLKTPIRFETMSLVNTLLDTLPAIAQHSPEVVKSLGEKLVAMLPKLSEHEYQEQIFRSLARSVHLFPEGVQTNIEALALCHPVDAQKLGQHGQVLLLCNLIRNARQLHENEGLPCTTKFTGLLNHAIEYLRNDTDTSSADLLSTLDSTFLRLTPGSNASNERAEKLSELKTAFLKARASFLNGIKTDSYTSASIHGRLLTLKQKLPANPLFRELLEHFEPRAQSALPV